MVVDRQCRSAAIGMWPRVAWDQSPGLSYTPGRPEEPQIELSPSLILTTWAAGLGAVTAVVGRWRVVGPGFIWLAGSVVVLLGGLGWWADGGWSVGVATAAAVAGIALARRPNLAAGALASAAIFYAASAVPDGGFFATLSGALVLGGITGEMLLGHWYLIDPQLPRWALQRLALAALVGVILEGALLLGAAGSSWENPVVGWAFVALALTSLGLMVAVWFSLKEPSYPGVMAATGLSYLAVLTSIGAAVAGRALVDEGSSLLAGSVKLAGTLLAP